MQIDTQRDAQTAHRALSEPLRLRAQELLVELAQKVGVDIRPDEVAAITRTMLSAQFKDGDSFKFDRTGAQFGRLMLILHGEVAVQLSGGGQFGRGRVVAEQPMALSSSVGEGGFLGMLSMFGGSPGQMTVKASGRLITATLSHDALAQLMRDSPEAASKLLFMMVHELAQIGVKYITKIVVMDRLARGMQMEMLQPSMIDPANEVVIGTLSA